MAFTKFASYEVAEVLDLKGSVERARTASLDKLSDFADYRTEDGFLYARIRAISSRVNKNHDGWPSVELAGGQEVFDRLSSLSRASNFTAAANPEHKYGYSTFLGKPIFVDHNNSDPDRARGVIVDARFHVEDHRTASELDPYYSDAPDNHLPPVWVELLLEIDAKSFPKLAAAIIEGSKDPRKGIDGFSMGCDVERSVCNICKNSATSPDEYCQHIRMKGAHFNVLDKKTGRRTSKKSYEDCYKIKFFEISAVFDPADETALLRELIQKEGAGLTPDDPGYADGMRREREEVEGRACPECGGPGTALTWTTAYGNMNRCPMGHTWSAEDPESVKQFQQQLNEIPEVEHPLGPQFGKTAAENPLDVYNPDVASGTCPHCQGKGCQQCNGKGYLVEAKFANALKQAMTARDYRMLADMIATAPVQERSALAEHAAGYLAQTNPAFDADRFMAAAIGKPQSGRDQFGGGHDYPGPEQPAEPTIPGMGPQMTQARTAENEPPQSTLLALPEEVDTMRTETVCPVCGSTMDQETCDVCGYIEPPEGFDNPDLEQAKEERTGPEESEGPPGAQQAGPEFADAGEQANENSTSNPPMTAHVTNDMSWDVSAPSRVAASSDQEVPIVPNQGPATDQPNEEVLTDPQAPITSSVQTAQDFIAAAQPRRQMSTHTADAASGAPAVATPDVSTDVEGVGGVDEASNEEASKADSQVDVEAVGGTGEEAVGADSTVSVDQGDEHSKNIEAIPTKTFDNGTGVEEQRDPITNQPFPASEDGVHSSGWHVQALESDPFPRPEDAPYGEGGSAVQGVQPADPVGRPEERVNVLDPTTSPDNNSGATTTWSGTEGNGVLRQQDPTTTESLEGADGVTKSTHMVTAFQLADLEIKLGMLDETRKYQRIGELEATPYREVKASLDYAQKVRTAASSGRLSSTRTSGRLPVLASDRRGVGRDEPSTKESSTEEEIPVEAIFVK